MPSYKNAERNTWYCAFYFTDWQGKRKKKKKEGFKTKREAQEWERKFLEQYADTPDVSFETLANAYLNYSQTRVKATTYKTRYIIVHKRLIPFFKDISINKITKRTINEWKNTLLKSSYKDTYIRTVYTHLVSIFNFAIDNYNLPSNPCTSLGTLSNTTKNVDYWTLSEFQKFSSYIKQPRYIMLFYLLFWTGMRIGEATALTWDDIDFENSSISITKSMARINGKYVAIPPKTRNSNRIVSLPNFILFMLKDYKRLTTFNNELLFEMCKESIHAKFHRSIKKANVKKIRIHDLRHSHASMLINAGCSPVDVADRLGHANASITLKVYSHFYQNKRNEIAVKLSTLY